jgi:hypothetical protein
LGHWGRSILVAQAIQRRAATDIHFVGTDPFGGLSSIAKAYGLRVTILGGGQTTSPETNATELERLFSKEKPDLLVFDGDIFRNLLYVKLPDIPKVTITNYFLTRLGKDQETAQSVNFAKYAVDWNRQREWRGLPPLRNHYQLQDTDLVILADPKQLLPADVVLPDTYVIHGPLCWEPDMPLPDELEDQIDLLYVSIGSSGRELPTPVINRIRAALGGPRVLVGHPDPSVFPEPLPPSWSRYFWLPGSEVLSRSKCAITQGGAGSTYQALQAGVPVVCWPRQINHSLLGQRIEDTGAGVLLKGDLDKQIEKLAAGFGNMAASAKHFRPPGPTYAADRAAEAISRLA